MKPTIALDVMGGDFAPSVNIAGAVEAVNKFNLNVVLVGDEEQIKKELKKFRKVGIKYTENLTVQHAKETITMEDTPSVAIRQKKDSSIVLATKLVAEGNAGAVVSAGNSGAIMAVCMMYLRTIENVLRPAIVTVLPTLKGKCVLLDVGANIDSKPKNLLQFAIMGNVFATEMLGIERPRVGLVSIGQERTKGNELTLETYRLIEKTHLNFVGNIEGGDIPQGNVDVAVTDGLVGNIILKFGEGVAEMLFDLIKSELRKHPFAFLSVPFLWNALKDLRKRVDYTEYGGALLLGTNGICVICHGRSNSKAIANALKTAAEYIDKNINAKISVEMKKYLI
ncbi:MAG: phosphate acyltransferase PlsX [Elusimicrobiota bacterium]|nr:phosphate acyltransferase PlsX [Elusimicrobiota bacterium]